MKLHDSVERPGHDNVPEDVMHSTIFDRMRYTPPASPIYCIHISRTQLLMYLERRNDHVSPMVDRGQRKEGNNDRAYYTHTLNNDQGQPLNAMWRYTLSCAPKHTRYYCADEGFEKAPSPNTIAMPPRQMPK